MADHARLAHVLGEFASTLLAQDRVEDILARLCARAVEVLPVSGAGVMRRDPDGSLKFATATDDRVSALESLQETAGEGPCSDADASGQPVVVADLSASRWSRFGPAAVAAGFGSVAALPLVAGGERLGVFDVYRVEPEELSGPDLAAARTLAEVAAVYLVHARDRARSQIAEDQLRRREQFHREVLDSLAAPTAVVDATGVIGTANTAWRSLLAGAADAAGSPAHSDTYGAVARRVHPAEDAHAAAAAVQDVLAGRARRVRLDLRDQRAEPDMERWFCLQVSPLTVEDGGAVVSYTDITASKQVEAQLFHQATHDPLTGLANRALLHDRLARAVRAARRSGSLAVLFLDLDGFKLVNDSYGHGTGDELLREVAARLLAAVRPQDTVARFAGDEFVVLCEGMASQLAAMTVADRLLKALTRPFRLPTGPITVTGSVGIALYEESDTDLPSGPAPGSSPEAAAGRLLQAADTAMFHAKASGRGRYAIYTDSLHVRAKERLELTEALRQALPQGELRLHYQPLVDLRTGDVVALEALTRWQPARGPLRDAAEFIDVAESSGLILEVDRWALRTAVAQAAEWAAAGLQLPRLAVNVSARRLSDPRLVADVAAALATLSTPPGLCLEITEHAVVERPAAVTAALEQLRALGVTIALDDFGTGHSSLAYLQQFPVDVVKLDRSFLEARSGGGGAGADADRLIGGIVALARTLDLAVVVEGIETQEHLDRVRALSAALDMPLIGQGYLLGPPAPHQVPPAVVQLPD